MTAQIGTVVSLVALCLALPAAAQDVPNPPGNLEKLGNFRTTGDTADIPTIPQTGPKADAIRKSLSQIRSR